MVSHSRIRTLPYATFQFESISLILKKFSQLWSGKLNDVKYFSQLREIRSLNQVV